MKIMLLTPALLASKVGHMASLLSASLLAQGHEVVVVRTEQASLFGAPAHAFGAPVLPWSATADILDHASQADVIAFQAGDNYALHAGCVAWLPVLPGIVCLHESVFGALLYGWSRAQPEQAAHLVAAWYGTSAAQTLCTQPDIDGFLAASCGQGPLTDWLCGMALGALVHGDAGLERVLNACPGPVHAIALAANDNAADGFDAETYTRQLLQTGTAAMRTGPMRAAVEQFAAVMREWGARDDMFAARELLVPLNIFNSP